MRIVIINGPNLNMLGVREPHLYGNQTYEDLCAYIQKACLSLGMAPDIFQSNHEGAIVDRIQAAYRERADGIILNPAAYTHTSVAILDAVKAVGIPTVEVHLTDVTAREPYRALSYVASACAHRVYGQGFEGYRLAAEFLKAYLEKEAGC